MATTTEFLGREGTERLVATVKDLLAGKQDKDESGAGGSAGHLARNITIPADGWISNEQTLTVEGVLEDPTRCTIIIGPDWSNAIECDLYGIDCVGQGDNTLTFQCSNVPNMDIVMNATILI